MSLSSFIAKTGTNPDFIAFNAHMWFAYAVVFTAHVPFAAAVMLAGAAVKEFWFDATYESPKQTFKDNALDFLGYATGAGLALAHIL